MMLTDWRARITPNVLLKRAKFLEAIRQYFSQESVLEVDTTILSTHTVTDTQLVSLSTDWQLDNHSTPLTLYLQTSPEFAMKRLLAQGSGSIYQLGKVFRGQERGVWHQPEFTLLEWYRVGWDYHQLMQEVEALIHVLLGNLPVQRCSYRQLFQDKLGFNPHQSGREDLQACLLDHGQDESFILSLSTKSLCLDALMSCVIEPQLKDIPVLFVYDYPVEQAALSATYQTQGDQVAQRFELYVEGIECANGYQELTDAQEQKRRMQADRLARKKMGLDDVEPDQRLLDALTQGLPDCAGVAVGIDRLFALHTGLSMQDSMHSVWS